MLFLYLCATLLTVFVGFRDALGRNAKIYKESYYLSAIARAFFVGQFFLGSLFFSATFYEVDMVVIEGVSKRCFWPFSLYIGMVMFAFLPYMIPNWEIKSMVTVLIFGPLTIVQPIVIIITMLYALEPVDSLFDGATLCFCIGCVFCLFFERFLSWMKWSQKDAEL